MLYSKISTDPCLLEVWHSHQFVGVVIEILIPMDDYIGQLKKAKCFFTWYISFPKETGFSSVTIDFHLLCIEMLCA